MAIIYKCGEGFELWTTKNKSSKWPALDLNPRSSNCTCKSNMPILDLDHAASTNYHTVPLIIGGMESTTPLASKIMG